MECHIVGEELIAVLVNEEIKEELSVEDEIHHHLTRVLRVKEQDEILILNGRGLKARGLIIKITKRSLLIKVIEKKVCPSPGYLGLLLGVPKKEALELSLKMAVEAQVTEIFLYKSDYSQNKKIYMRDRIAKILESGSVQSNNPWCPVVQQVEFKDLPNILKNKNLVLLHPLGERESLFHQSKLSSPIVAIGPEGGWSEAEVRFFMEHSSVLNLGEVLLRTPTAIAYSIGYLRGLLKSRG